jgi:M6 family metalloprotease-like protein
MVVAVPAKRGVWRTLTLENGTEVRAQLVGDEHGHFWCADDGRTYRMKANGIAQTVDANKIIAKAKSRRQQVNAQRLQRLKAQRRVGEVGSYTGMKKAIVLLVNFKDTKFEDNHDNALFNRIANEEGFSEGNFKGSMADYFKAQSRGQFELDFDVVGPLTVSKDASYYGQNDSGDNDMYPGEMVCEAVKLAKDQVADWTIYDWDNDGYVDQVYVVYAGMGEADGGAEDTIWPHAWGLTEAKYYGDGTGAVTVSTGLKVDSYACGPELNGQTGEIGGIGTMCHEFSHCLGYPDFYDIDYSGGQGMGSYDLMDSGSYNGDGYQPAGYTSYELWMAGWLEPIQLEGEDVSITEMKSLQNGGESYIIYNKGNRNEYMMLENRQLEGWDASLPYNGLLILHCDYDADVWANNGPNDDPNHQRMTIVPATGDYSYYSWQGQKFYYDAALFPNDLANAFNKNFKTYDSVAKKAAQFFNKNTNGTYWIDSSVENIEQNDNGTISFDFVADYAGSAGQSTDDYLFYESFDMCDAAGGNDGLWSGAIANGEFLADNDGWVAEKPYAANQCAKFGTSSVAGSATTPEFTVSGTATLTFKAGAWNAKNDGTTLNLSVSNGTISPATLTIEKGAFTDCTATITATGNVTVTFAAEKGRFFLDEVLVVADTTIVEPVDPIPVTLMGDVDSDGQINVTDAVLIIDEILDKNPWNFNATAADVNFDSYINVTDVVLVIDHILGKTNLNPNRAAAVDAEVGTISLSTDMTTVSLTNPSAYTAFQMDVTLPMGVSLESALLTERAADNHAVVIRKLDNGSFRIIGVSMQNEAFEGNVGELLKLQLVGNAQGAVAIDNVLFVTPQGVQHGLAGVNAFGDVTGISDATRLNDNGQMINDNQYTLDGRKLDGKPMTKGIYVNGGLKVVIK